VNANFISLLIPSSHLCSVAFPQFQVHISISRPEGDQRACGIHQARRRLRSQPAGKEESTARREEKAVAELRLTGTHSNAQHDL
ncbi:hypothetical protein J1605_006212, partial [Eschrichtius robustus]